MQNAPPTIALWRPERWLDPEIIIKDGTGLVVDDVRLQVAAEFPTPFWSADFFAPRLEVLLYLRHELVGYCAIDQAMVVAQREMNDGANGD